MGTGQCVLQRKWGTGQMEVSQVGFCRMTAASACSSSTSTPWFLKIAFKFHVLTCILKIAYYSQYLQNIMTRISNTLQESFLLFWIATMYWAKEQCEKVRTQKRNIWCSLSIYIFVSQKEIVETCCTNWNITNCENPKRGLKHVCRLTSDLVSSQMHEIKELLFCYSWWSHNIF